VLFPERMSRLVWFVPESRLGERLAWLASRYRFHPGEQVRLGGTEDLSDLRRQFEAQQFHARFLEARKLLSIIPGTSLLHYRPGECRGAVPAGALALDDSGLFLWAGENEPPDHIREYLFPESVPEPPPMPVRLSREQWDLLFANASCIGHLSGWAIIDGWLPKHEAERLECSLKGEACILTDAERSGLPMDAVPVLYSRPPWLAGFGRLMGLFGVTGYREIDPTFFLAFGFTLMFGMMFADLGQGLALFVAGMALLWHGGRTGDRRWIETAEVVIPVGLSAAFFGALFGVCFAREDVIAPLWFRPRDEILFYLGASVVLGAVTIIFGMLLGQVNAARTGRWRAQLWEVFGPLGLTFFIALVTAAAAWTLDMDALALAMCILAVCILAVMFVRHSVRLASQGILMCILIALIETYDFAIRFVVQTFSFARIAAFSIAHVALSSAVVLAADSTSSAWASLSIMMLGNAVIIVAEGVIVAIQTLRLNFFEFFTKFIQGNGRAFTPLATGGNG